MPSDIGGKVTDGKTCYLTNIQGITDRDTIRDLISFS